MARYIDADRLINEFTGNGGVFVYGIDVVKAIVSRIYLQPTADVVEVVRCSECAIPHNKWTGCPKLNGLIPPPNFFCGYGERRKK